MLSLQMLVIFIVISSAICTHAQVVNSAALPLSLNPSIQAVFLIVMFVHAYSAHYKLVLGDILQNMP